MKVYVAAASREISQAKKWMDKLREVGIEVTSTWVETITNVGNANPADASWFQRRTWSEQDLKEVAEANLLWLLMPQAPTSGAWVEFGYAVALNKQMVVSGPNQTRSIFTGLATTFVTDEDAFEAIYLRGGLFVHKPKVEEREDCEHAQNDHPLCRNMLEGAAERDGRVCRLGWPLRD